MQTFRINTLEYQAENLIEGILLNPNLSENFYSTPTFERSVDDLKHWWCVPFIETDRAGFKVICLDGNTSNGPSLLGYFDDLNDAIEMAQRDTCDQVECNTDRQTCTQGTIKKTLLETSQAQTFFDKAAYI